MIEDVSDHRRILNEADDPHRPLTFRADQGIYLVYLLNQLGSTFPESLLSAVAGIYSFPALNNVKEDKEVKIQNGKTWSLMSKFRQVFYSRDIDRRVKYIIYISGPLNMLLWGSGTWNLSDTNMEKLNSSYHSAIRWILGIRREKMKEERIMNKKVR